MDDYLNNRQKEVLLRLLANPTDTGGAYLSNLQELVKTYPQSGLLRALYGRALNEPAPMVAGGYFDSRALHRLLYHHDNIASITNDQVVIQPDGKLFNKEAVTADSPAAITADAQLPEDITAVADEPVIADISEEVKSDAFNVPLAEPADILVEEALPQNNITETAPEPALDEPQQTIDSPFAPAPWEVTTEPEVKPEPLIEEEPLGRAPWELDEEEEEAPQTQALAASQADETQLQPEGDDDNEPLLDDSLAAKLAYWSGIEDEYDAPGAQIPVAPPEPVNAEPEVHFYAEPEYAEQTPINEEVYDEITGIDDINLAQLNAEPPVLEEEINAAPEPDAPQAQATTGAPQPAKQDEADRLILGNIAATDYFVFDKAFGDNKAAEPAPTPEPVPKPMFREHPATRDEQPQLAPATAPAHHDISKYHDEKMPYTFMWWLDKTRKEHGTLYQPYAQAPVNRQAPVKSDKPDELQQQYFENIFHLSSVDELVPDAAQTIEFDMQSKEDRIIQRFITEDPHIHPPVGEKLDTENKAKKSSEDGYEMVTETLARIYADQMLFPKAIATYKKLMLKYPEKSRYFASRIENLEKRTN